ncbi:amidohydrolase [Acidaminobacter hydrogenoformans]|uniref:Amidohydrolase 3 domain-containing protein n=1 Tax=Acidaminobacter hydrogenoformans DSM 2784 TaxID=1120920 RepID=A0A1G5S1N7_9FIRM|nr:amidohydrolase [Acidaminobacter hydrogenoformans]SCZ80047.1 hypothetical protein SAMN03080599_02076 [Acidaminobacter hydrogenoformans DSM 2784]
MQREAMDLLLMGGRIYTFKEEGDTVEALGIKAGRIVFAGRLEEALKHDIKETCDLKGKTVIPGLGDSHLHLYAYCQNQTYVALDETRSMEAFKAKLIEKAKKTEPGEWIRGAGFDQTKFVENRMPTRHDLDQVSTDHPIVVRRCCLHVLVANSAAIELAKINDQTDQAFPGMIERDEKGDLTGVFREQSAKLFDDIMPDPLKTADVKKRVMAQVLQDMASKGITTIHTYAAKLWRYEESIDLYRELEEEGRLPIRVTVCKDEFFEKAQIGPQDRKPGDKTMYGAYKIFTDGSLGARTAALTVPYSDDPGNTGILCDPEVLKETVANACLRGMQPAIHAIGDRAMEATLDAIENAVKVCPELLTSPERPPFRIIHAQMVTNEHLQRLKALPIVLDIQPIFLSTDLYWIEDRLGSERLGIAYRWKSMRDEGIMMTGGSDCPVEAYDPLPGIFAAVARQDLSGYPPGGWQPHEKLSVYDAFCLFSKNIPYANGEQALLGTLETGKFSDLVVIDRDPFEIEAPEILKLKILRTMVAGEWVFDSGVIPDAGH